MSAGGKQTDVLTRQSVAENIDVMMWSQLAFHQQNRLNYSFFFCLFVSAAKKTSHMLCVMMKKPPRNNSKIMKLYRNELFLYIPLQQAVDSWRARVYSSCRFDSERD